MQKLPNTKSNLQNIMEPNQCCMKPPTTMQYNLHRTYFPQFPQTRHILQTH